MNFTLENKNPKEKMFIKFNKAGYEDMTSLYLSSGLREFIKYLEMDYIELGYNLDYKVLAVKINRTKGLRVCNDNGKLKAAVATTTLLRYLINLLPEIKLCTTYNLVKVDKDILAMNTSLIDAKKVNPKNLCFTWIEENRYKRKKTQFNKVY
ncbi:hypothetical protein O0Q50_22225 [Priestia aryabhattai]|uniref:Uncharacterized protein n=1 Tax=Priestia aryabhattai TaxID=412384 RepID=A0AAX6NDC0_PRIAR|nr:hypothetical protein [Priestia aryabhattai]MDU9693901.1 hypothetical protein [Priestia aryabhattai]